ncbi:MAG: hypothetical protein NPINA01_23100 [Nitrospinaceae bacterium]|nr:MAG: hypothetical protein NPINA01_23100 [Nitrospinaceae bacterium]
MHRLTFLLALLFLIVSFSQPGFTEEDPHGFKPGDSPFGFKAGEGPLPLSAGSDKELIKHNKAGTGLYLKQMYENALNHFQTARSIKPSSGVILYNEAVTLDKLDRHREATLRFQQAKDHANGNVLILNSPILEAHLK